MQKNTPSRNTIRLTRRGRLALVATGAVVAGTAVAVPLLTLGDDDPRPTTLVIPEGQFETPIGAEVQAIVLDDPVHQADPAF